MVVVVVGEFKSKSLLQKGQKQYHKLDIVVGSNRKVPKLNISSQKKRNWHNIKKILFDINLWLYSFMTIINQQWLLTELLEYCKKFSMCFKEKPINICKTFKRAHLHYGDFMFNKTYNNTYHWNLSSVKNFLCNNWGYYRIT